MLKIKRVLVGCLVFSMMFQNVAPVLAKGANVTQKQRNATDEEFLGIWDTSKKAWKVSPSINYNYNKALGTVEELVKKGQYDAAKEALLKYYRSVDRQIEASTREKPSYGQINMLMEDIYTGASPVGEITLPTTKKTITINVTPRVATAVKSSQDYLSFMLMGKNKNQEALFDSRETQNPPTLKLTVDGKPMSIVATSDTYVRAGKYKDKNYGKEKMLYVEDSGVPFDDETKRTYVQFDLSKLTPNSKITSASIQLNGCTTGKTEMELLVFNSEQVTVDEVKKTWSNAKTTVLSFKGGDGTYKNLSFFPLREGVDQQYHNTQSRFWYFMGLVGAYKEKKDERYAARFLEEIESYYSQFGGGDLLLPINTRTSNDTLNAGFRLDQTVAAYWGLLDSQSMTPDKHLQYLKFLHFFI